MQNKISLALVYDEARTIRRLEVVDHAMRVGALRGGREAGGCAWPGPVLRPGRGHAARHGVSAETKVTAARCSLSPWESPNRPSRHWPNPAKKDRLAGSRVRDWMAPKKPAEEEDFSDQKSPHAHFPSIDLLRGRGEVTR